MTDTVLAWHDGSLHHLSRAEWASVCASFLGSGFRVDLPSGAQRDEAADYELGRVLKVAELMGAPVSSTDWQQAVHSHADLDVEVTGGWPRAYSGTSSMWIATEPIPDEPAIETAAPLPSRAHPRPTTGLPLFSRLADELALTSVEADCGLWIDPDGRVVRSTAGPIIAQRADGRWATGTDTATWLGRRTIAEHDATPDLRIEDLDAAPFVGLIRRARGVLPLVLVPAGSAT